jgi:hypothetical protein
VEERQRSFDELFFLPGASLREPEYVIAGFLPRGYLAILAGDPKVGKTCLATAMSVAIASGTPFAGLQVEQSPVLWLSLEESPRERAAALGTFHELQSQFPWFDGQLTLPFFDDPPECEEDDGEVFGFPKEWQVNLPLFTCYTHIAIDTDEGIDALEYWVNRTGARLIVVDPLHASHSGRSLADGWAARRTLQRLKSFCSRKLVTALVLHHLGVRNGRPRVAENAQLSAIASMFMLLSASTKGDGREVRLTCQGRGSLANGSFVFSSRGPGDYRLVSQGQLNDNSRPTTAEVAILKLLLSVVSMSSNEIVAALQNQAEGTVRNALVRLRKIGEINRCRTSERSFRYSLSSRTRNLIGGGGPKA